MSPLQEDNQIQIPGGEAVAPVLMELCPSPFLEKVPDGRCQPLRRGRKWPEALAVPWPLGVVVEGPQGLPRHPELFILATSEEVDLEGREQRVAMQPSGVGSGACRESTEKQGLRPSPWHILGFPLARSQGQNPQTERSGSPIPPCRPSLPLPTARAEGVGR